MLINELLRRSRDDFAWQEGSPAILLIARETAAIAVVDSRRVNGHRVILIAAVRLVCRHQLLLLKSGFAVLWHRCLVETHAAAAVACERLILVLEGTGRETPESRITRGTFLDLRSA